MKNSFLSQFDKVSEISKGMSGDKKYRVEKGGQAYLLRSADITEYKRKKDEYDYLNHLNQASLTVPRCIAFEKCDEDTKVYTLLSWVVGKEAEKVLPNAPYCEQYAYGVQAGSILRKIHENSPKVDTAKNWYERYFEVIKPRLEAFLQEGISFVGDERILRFIEENKYLLKSRPLCYHHGDYHMGNLIINAGKLWVIDWHTVDFDNIGDPCMSSIESALNIPCLQKGRLTDILRIKYQKNSGSYLHCILPQVLSLLLFGLSIGLQMSLIQLWLLTKACWTCLTTWRIPYHGGIASNCLELNETG